MNQFLESDFNVDGDGDIFGDFTEYSGADWGMDINGEDNNHCQTNQDDFNVEDEDLYVAKMAEEEIGMEPEHITHSSSPITGSAELCPMTDSMTNSLETTSGKALRLQGGFEEELKNELIIV